LSKQKSKNEKRKYAEVARSRGPGTYFRPPQEPANDEGVHTITIASVKRAHHVIASTSARNWRCEDGTV
jgi:hypothetical protein